MFVQSKMDSVRNRGIRPMRRRSRRGVSLIEILIVMVILVVGILTIIRLFPSGFFSVESVGNAALADSLGIAAIQEQTQNGAGLPDAILPGKMDALGNPTATLTDGAYDPNDAQKLDNAHVVSNETLTVPSARIVGGVPQSIYVVNYGPVLMGSVDPAGSVTQLPQYVSINSVPWVQSNGDAAAALPLSATPVYPQDSLAVGQPNFLVDLIHKQIAIPYAPYTPTSVTTAVSYAQKMVLWIQCADGTTYQEYLNVPAATPLDTTNAATKYAPKDASNVQFLPNTPTNYQGGWFDPTTTYDVSPSISPPPGAIWTKVILYRPFQAIKNTTGGGAFDSDPYEFMLPNANLVGSAATQLGNLGAIAFNPLGAGRVGVKPLKAQVTYQTYGWRILHEDRDIPALTAGNTTVARLTLKNLRRVGDADPDNNIDTGLIPGSNVGFIIQDLDTGLPVATPLNDEDTNGTNAAQINVSYATGRVTFPAGAFGDTNAHRVRIYYAGDADWTVAVQKSSAHYADVSGSATANGILPGQFAYDGALNVYFPQSEAGRTVAFEGSYMVGTTMTSFALTGVIGPALYSYAGSSYVRVNLSDTSAATPALPTGATNVTFSAVRGLSARAVVAWKERDLWKVHSVDTVLTQSQ